MENDKTTTIQQSDPWSGKVPYLTGGPDAPGVLPEAANLYQNSPGQFYPGQTYAPFSPETLTAQQAQTNRAMTGSPITGAMQDQLQANLQGDYLDAKTNPYLMPLGDEIAADVLPRIQGTFEGAGRTGSGLAARAAGQGLGSAMAKQAYQNYSDERNRQMQSMLFAPQAANQDYYDIAKLSEVGTAREGLAQQAITEAMNRFNFENQEPWNRLGKYNQLIQGTGGSSSTTQATGGRPSLGSGLLGGGLLGGGAGYLAGKEGLFGLSPEWGAGIGAGLGGILGVFN